MAEFYFLAGDQEKFNSDSGEHFGNFADQREIFRFQKTN
jgi:hypothetical protein